MSVEDIFQERVEKPASDLEADAEREEYLEDRARFYLELVGLAEELGNPERAKQLRWEAFAFAYPDLTTDIANGALDYFERRMGETSNPLYRAQYGLILWDFKHGRAGLHAIAAAEAFLQSAEIHWRHRLSSALVDALNRAVVLASSVRNADLLERAKLRIFELVRELAGRKDYDDMVDLIGVLMNSKSITFTPDEAMELRDDLNQALENCGGRKADGDTDAGEGAGESFDLVMIHAIYDLLIRLEGSQKDETAAQSLREERARSYEMAGDRVNPTARLLRYRQAAAAYRSLGMTADLDRIKVKLKEAGEVAEVDMQEHSGSVLIDKEEVEKVIGPVLAGTLEEGLSNLAMDEIWVPNVAEAVRQGEEFAEKYVFASLVSRMHLRNRNIASVPETDEQIKRERFVEQYQFSMEFIASLYLKPILDRMIERFGLDADKLVEFLADSIIDDDKLKLLHVGFERYFAGDYVSAIHVLTPHLEDILRRLLEKIKKPTTTLRKGTTFHEIDLGIVLDLLGKLSAFQPNLIEYYKVFLMEQSGYNLRNRVGHGLVSPDECNDTRAVILIHSLLTLKRFVLRASPASPGEMAAAEQGD